MCNEWLDKNIVSKNIERSVVKSSNRIQNRHRTASIAYAYELNSEKKLQKDVLI